jgi:hypothetical protein
MLEIIFRTWKMVLGIIGGVLPSREIDELARRGELVVSKHEKMTKRHADGRSAY